MGDDPAAPSVGVRKLKVKKSEALWLMTFSDLSILLMCFFVLLLSFSTFDKKKYDHVRSGMKTLAAKKPDNTETLETMAKKISKVVAAKKLDRVVEVQYDVDGLAIEFKDAMLFDVGSAAANPKTAKVMSQVMQVIAKAPGDYRLVFEGHTDDVPIGGQKFGSNWDLASARGITLLDSFKQRGVAENRMSVLAYAHTRPKVPFKGLKGEALAKARAANRRVVIRIE
jgi:chemotaxis protein MotB